MFAPNFCLVARARLQLNNNFFDLACSVCVPYYSQCHFCKIRRKMSKNHKNEDNTAQWRFIWNEIAIPAVLWANFLTSVRIAHLDSSAFKRSRENYESLVPKFTTTRIDFVRKNCRVCSFATARFSRVLLLLFWILIRMTRKYFI